MGRDTERSLAIGWLLLTTIIALCCSSELGAIRDTGERGVLSDLRYLVGLRGHKTISKALEVK